MNKNTFIAFAAVLMFFFIFIMVAKQPSPDELREKLIGRSVNALEWEIASMYETDLFRAGPRGVKIIMQWLTDRRVVSQASLWGEKPSIQWMANDYLIVYANRDKIPPPPLALEFKKPSDPRKEDYPTQAKWTELQKAWGDWYSENKSRL